MSQTTKQMMLKEKPEKTRRMSEHQEWGLMWAALGADADNL